MESIKSYLFVKGKQILQTHINVLQINFLYLPYIYICKLYSNQAFHRPINNLIFYFLVQQILKDEGKGKLS